MNLKLEIDLFVPAVCHSAEVYHKDRPKQKIKFYQSWSGDVYVWYRHKEPNVFLSLTVPSMLQNTQDLFTGRIVAFK